MLMVGLTGGIATGKSLVSGMFRELGARVIDADELAREAIEPGQPAYKETIHIFGPRILGSDGRIDRKALGDIVFRDPARRAMLEAAVHPRVLEAERRIAGEIARTEPGTMVLFDAALLIETGEHKRMDKLVVVWCRPETQLRRLMEKCCLTEEEARLRISAQMPIDEKRRHATHIIDNEGGVEETRAQVEHVYSELAEYV